MSAEALMDRALTAEARVAELEAELHKLAWSRDDRAKELEAEVENLQHNLERCRDGYTQTERIRKRTAARLEQAIGGWNEAYLRAEKVEARVEDLEAWYEQTGIEVKRMREAEAEVEKLRRIIKENRPVYDCAHSGARYASPCDDCPIVRAEKAEAELAEERKRVEDYDKRVEFFETKLAEMEDIAAANALTAKEAQAKLAGVEKGLTLICEFTQEHGDWSELPAGKAAARVHNIARAALEGKP